MAHMTIEELTERLELADQLHFGREQMLEPQDLPGRYGRVSKAIDRLLQAIDCEAAVGGGWAVWYHGYEGRLTQDVDIALAADRIDEFLRAASVSGFDILAASAGRWPKIWHKETQIRVDILPEGAQPGQADRPAPTTIPHPREMGARKGPLTYIRLCSLIELKLAAGRIKDNADIVELIRQNPGKVAEMREHLAQVHADYVAKFDVLAAEAGRQHDE